MWVHMFVIVGDLRLLYMGVLVLLLVKVNYCRSCNSSGLLDKCVNSSICLTHMAILSILWVSQIIVSLVL
jgi:hypothetical protein